MAIFGRAVRASQWTATVLAGALLAACAGAGTHDGQAGAAAPAAAPAPAAAAPGAAALAFSTLDQTGTSRIEAARTVLVRDPEAWRRLWSEHAGPEAAPPPVDFATSMVIGVFLGTRPSGCYSTAIVGLEHVGGKIRVQQVDQVPGPLVRCMMMIATPAHLVVTARSEAPVEFTTKTVEL